jgi:uncharacterized protein (TIGR04255 family)
MGRNVLAEPVPKRIHPDAIAECVVEIRFAPDDLPEVFLGRLLTSSALKGLRPVRLPEADIPFSARESDPKLRYHPIYQLEAGNELVRIGTGAISLHVLPPYPGWDAFYRRIEEIVCNAWSDCGTPPLERCGLRYVNALTSDGHGVRSIEDLNLSVTVNSQKLTDVSLSFLTDDTDNTETLVRVASVKHVQGDMPENATFAVDLDVRTTGSLERWGAAELLSWLAAAREIKNKHFFELLPARIIETLEVN